jgi:hypothetical protein
MQCSVLFLFDYETRSSLQWRPDLYTSIVFPLETTETGRDYVAPLKFLTMGPPTPNPLGKCFFSGTIFRVLFVSENVARSVLLSGTLLHRPNMCFFFEHLRVRNNQLLTVDFFFFLHLIRSRL